VLIDNPEAAVSGCGEPPVINVGAVAANAIFDLAQCHPPTTCGGESLINVASLAKETPQETEIHVR
jgi:hypothetical protein